MHAVRALCTHIFDDSHQKNTPYAAKKYPLYAQNLRFWAHFWGFVVDIASFLTCVHHEMRSIFRIICPFLGKLSRFMPIFGQNEDIFEIICRYQLMIYDVISIKLAPNGLILSQFEVFLTKLLDLEVNFGANINFYPHLGWEICIFRLIRSTDTCAHKW